MKFGILGAMSSEIEMIKKALSNLSIREVKGFRFFEGTYGDKEIVLTECSVGKVNSAICTQILIDHFSPDFIINTGIAGGLNEKLDVLSMVIGKELTFYDFDHSIMRNFFPYQDKFLCDQRAVDLCKEIAREENIHAITGKIVTGDLFVEDSKKKAELVKVFGADCVEMEGASISNTAFINGLPFIVLRAISDLANDGGMMTYEEFKIKASDTSANLVLKMVERY